MTQKQLNIGFIGNFIPPFSTENDRKWSFEKLGHTVIPYQENRTSIDQLFHDGYHKKFDILFYSHTHGWEIPGLINFFKTCKEVGVPTVSVHLDRWAWLGRVADVGREATWFTEYLFMADGSPEAEELYKKHNLNWYYLKAGVLERECQKLPPDTATFPEEIVFVGSRGYHQEYPFRRELVDFLKTTYKDNFAHWGADGRGVVRGMSLNTLMSSAKIVVGDSCFGGRPCYVSDRYYETRGRGGFLLHPRVVGVDTVGVGHYEALSLSSLQEKIDYYLAHDEERETMRTMGFEWVKSHETYTNRAQEMLRIIYGN